MKYFWLILLPLVALYWTTWRELQQSRLREISLRTQLEETSGLADHLSAHFLFNSLNTIRYFVRTNAATAREMLLDLSLVLQAAMRKEARVCLRDELESGRAYLRLEQARLGPRLEVVDTVDESASNHLVRTRVLPHLLQSLVGAVAQRSSGGSISLSLENDFLVLQSDGLAAPLPSLSGITHTNLGESTRIEWRLS